MTNSTPSPDLIFAAIARILERRHGVRVQYKILHREENKK